MMYLSCSDPSPKVNGKATPMSPMSSPSRSPPSGASSLAERDEAASTAARDSPIFTRVPYSVYDEAANIEAEDRRRSLNLTALQPRSDKAPLEPNHTGFIFYGSDEPDGNRWGEETPFRFHLERKLSMLLEVPLILLVIQGGQGTLRAVHAAVASAERIWWARRRWGAGSTPLRTAESGFAPARNAGGPKLQADQSTAGSPPFP